MRINSQLCLTISWLAILVRAESSYPERSEESNQRRVSSEEDQRSNHKTAAESRQRFSIESHDFDTGVPPEFALEISKLRIPVAEDLPRRIETSHEDDDIESGRNYSKEDESDDGRDGEDDRDGRDEERDDGEDDRTEEDEDDRRGPDYDGYDSPPRNTIPHNYEDSEEKPGHGKKRPHVNYEVTETIPYDTKTMRPKQKVYPLPPPCPGAPPPTFPPPDPPSTKKPPPPPPQPPTYPPPPPPPTFPPFPKPFSDHDGLFSHDDFFDSYFPTSYMSSPSFQRASVRLPAPRSAQKHSPKRYTLDGDESQRITRVARPRVILRYHQPAALVIRKIQHPASSVADKLIIRKPLAPPVKEVHIHHHHDPPVPVFHIHQDGDESALDTARFKAKVAGQRLLSTSQFESTKTGPFAEPPAKKRRFDNPGH